MRRDLGGVEEGDAVEADAHEGEEEEKEERADDEGAAVIGDGEDTCEDSIAEVSSGRTSCWLRFSTRDYFSLCSRSKLYTGLHLPLLLQFSRQFYEGPFECQSLPVAAFKV